jgi:hypothetical protein
MLGLCFCGLSQGRAGGKPDICLLGESRRGEEANLQKYQDIVFDEKPEMEFINGHISLAGHQRERREKHAWFRARWFPL